MIAAELLNSSVVQSAITVVGVAITGFFTYLGVRSQLGKSVETNTTQHGDVVSAVRRMGSSLQDLDATLGLLVATQGFPLFKNTVDGDLVWANSAALEMLGLPFEELSNPNVWPTVIHPDDRQRVVDNWRRQIASGQQQPSIGFRYVHPITKAITHVRGRSRPIKSDTGEVLEWVSMVVPTNKE